MCAFLSHFVWAPEIKGKLQVFISASWAPILQIHANAHPPYTPTHTHFYFLFSYSFHNLNLWPTKNFHFQDVDLSMKLLLLLLFFFQPHHIIALHLVLTKFFFFGFDGIGKVFIAFKYFRLVKYLILHYIAI